jgi:transcriptional regulator with XRE-family HTH domain
MTVKEVLGTRLLLRRRALRLTQRQLAEKMQCPYQLISSLERGHQSLYIERLVDIAQALGVSTDYLLGLSEQESPYA